MMSTRGVVKVVTEDETLSFYDAVAFEYGRFLLVHESNREYRFNLDKVVYWVTPKKEESKNDDIPF